MQEALISPRVRRGDAEARALLLGVAGAAAAGMLWFGVSALLTRHMSALSVLVGFAVAGGVVGRAGRRGRDYQAVSLALTLAALLITEAFVMRLLVVRELVSLGSTSELPLVLPLNVMWDLVAAGIAGDPPLSLFWAVALWFAVSIPRKRKWES